MKNLIIPISAALLCAACSSTKTASDKVSLNGEWNIVEINSVAVDTTKLEIAPYLVFDTKKNDMYGCAGCNSINGTTRIDDEKQTLSFAQIATTLMLCAEMDTEKGVLDALEKVKGYKEAGEKRVALTDAKGKAVLTLQQK